MQHDEYQFISSGHSFVAPSSARQAKVGPGSAAGKRHGVGDTAAMAEAAAAAAAAAATTNKHVKVGGSLGCSLCNVWLCVPHMLHDRLALAAGSCIQ